MKITLPEIIMLVLIAGGRDIADMMFGILSLVPVVGIFFTFIAFVVNLMASMIIAIWFFAKGQSAMRGTATAVLGSVIDSIPMLNILPICTITVVAAIMMVNNEGRLPRQVAGTIKLAGKAAKL